MSNGFDDRFLDELKAKCTLVDIISSYVPLKRQSGHYMCCCPFHNEKTPSFVINEQQGYYHCFGCHASGDVIKFVMDMESISFMDAVKMLADRAGMEMPSFNVDPKFTEKKEHKDVLKALMKDVAKYYNANLFDPEKGKEAREYLMSRGISEETMKRYGLGVSLSYDGMLNYMRRKGASLKDMQECSLLNDVNNPIDFYANRIIIPIINSMGDVIAFGGRIFHGEEETAKYKNSKNTILFDKSYTVYGINYIKRDKKSTGMSYTNVILVEGYMDVISLGAAGFRNAVACMGTALTEHQAQEIVKINRNVLVCYDGDGAGRTAALKNIDILAAQGAEVKVVSLDKEQKDADEVIRAGGPEAFRKKLEEALPIVDYKLKVCKEAFDLSSNDGKAKYVKNALKVLSKIDSKSEREVYLNVVSKYSNVSVDTLKSELDPVKDKPKNASIEDRNITVESDKKALYSSRYVINRIMHNAPYVSFSTINRDWFIDELHKKIYSYALVQPTGSFNIANMYTELGYDEKEINNVFDMNLNFATAGKESEYYQDCLKTIANTYLQKKKEEVTKEFESSTDATRKKELMSELQLLTKKIKSNDFNEKI